MSETLQNFLDDLRNNKAPDTRKIYEDRFKDVTGYLSVTNTDVFLSMDARVFEDKVHMYIKSRAQGGKKYSFLNQAVSAVRLFCIANRITLNFPWLYAKIPKPEASEDETEVKQDRPYNSKELADLFKLAFERKNIRAINSMGFMYTGGPRVGALAGIRIENLQYVEKYDLYAILGYAQSKRFRYWIITAPWLKPFIDEYKGNRTEGKFFISHVNNEPVTKSALVKEVWQLLVDAGVRKLNENGDTTSRHDTMLDHGFRKAHSTACEVSGMKDDHISRLRGSRKGLKGVYQLPTPLEIIESTNYMEAVKRLQNPLTF